MMETVCRRGLLGRCKLTGFTALGETAQLDCGSGVGVTGWRGAGDKMDADFSFPAPGLLFLPFFFLGCLFLSFGTIRR